MNNQGLKQDWYQLFVIIDKIYKFGRYDESTWHKATEKFSALASCPNSRDIISAFDQFAVDNSSSPF